MPPIQILYAEDFPTVLYSVVEVLEFEGWWVDACSNGTEALRKIESATPYDLLLLDYQLPDINGVELIRRARTLVHRRHTPTIMLSATALQIEARRAGADVFLRKPDGMLRLVETIRQLLNLPEPS